MDFAQSETVPRLRRLQGTPGEGPGNPSYLRLVIYSFGEGAPRLGVHAGCPAPAHSGRGEGCLSCSPERDSLAGGWAGLESGRGGRTPALRSAGLWARTGLRLRQGLAGRWAGGPRGPGQRLPPLRLPPPFSFPHPFFPVLICRPDHLDTHPTYSPFRLFPFFIPSFLLSSRSLSIPRYTFRTFPFPSSCCPLHALPSSPSFPFYALSPSPLSLPLLLFPCHCSSFVSLNIVRFSIYSRFTATFFAAAAPSFPRSLFPFFLPPFQRFRAGFREPNVPRSSGRCALAQGALVTTSLRPFGAPPSPAAPGRRARERPLSRKRAGPLVSPGSRGRHGREGQRQAGTGPVPARGPSAPPAAGSPFDVAGPAGMRPGYQSPSWISKVSA